MAEASFRLVILTGMSGAGKSTALRCFEDLGFYCIDNLPPSLIGTFVQLYMQTPGSSAGVAIVSDIRSGELFGHFRTAVEVLREQSTPVEVLFIDCENSVLAMRFKVARRSHPLGPGLGIDEALRQERQKMEPVLALATHVVDTSDLTASQLRERLMGIYAGADKAPPLTVTVVSFGYKYTIPGDADFVFDVRFLRNPFYIEELRPLTGNDPTVAKYVLADEPAQPFLEHVLATLASALPHYPRVYKYAAVVAFGCTGGKHRSVTVANSVAAQLAQLGFDVHVQHRDLDRL